MEPLVCAVPASTDDYDKLIICEHCDLLMHIPPLEVGLRARCPRCAKVLSARHKDAFNRLLAFSLSAIIFLLAAHGFTFLSLKVQGQEHAIYLFECIELLASQGEGALAIGTFLVIVLIPALFLVGILYSLIAIRQRWISNINLSLIRLILVTNPWAMGEIFIIGVLVSLIKIVSLADVGLGLSFWAYVMFSVFMTATLLHLDKVQIWNWVERSGRAD